MLRRKKNQGGDYLAGLPASDKNTWISADKRFFDRSSVIYMLVGTILFIVGVAMDMSSSKYPEAGQIFRACNEQLTSACMKVLQTIDSTAHGLSEFNMWLLAAEALKAIGLTIIAAIAISSTVDHRTRQYFFRQLAHKTEQLGSNVITGMFESQHPDRLFELVKANILQKKLLRKNIDINYTLANLSFDEAGHRLSGKQFLRVDVILSTITENVNIAQGADDGSINLPLRLGLPNPMVDELKPLVKINSFRIGDDDLPQEKIDELNVELQSQLNDDDKVDASVEIPTHSLPFGKSITCSGSYTMIKELEDTEVFRTAEIAENIHLTVVDKSTHNLIIRARSMSQGKLHNQRSPSAQQWKLDDLSLPLQGIMVWWKLPLP